MDEDLIESDENDDDYVPSEEESDDAIGSDYELDETNWKQKTKGKRKRRQTRSKSASLRKRKAGIQLEEEEEKEVSVSENDDDEIAKTPNVDKSTEQPVEEEKKKADSLWADFLKDVDPPPKSKLITISKPQTQTITVDFLKDVDPPPKSRLITISKPQTQIKDPPINTVSTKKTTITQIFDFAGESVSITKEVDADSEEAKQQAENKDEEETKEEAIKTNSGGVKRAGSLGNVIGQITGKKSKLNTLEKSRLDWETFKKTENIEDDLRLHNKGKDGYLDRQAFLQRVDVRQFELEKDIRAVNRSKR